MSRRLLALAAALSAAALPLAWAAPVPSPSGYNPPLAPASDEAQKAIPRFKLADGLQARVWAAEPLLTQPVAFCFDERGRAYVAETFRHSNGVTDNRGHMYWLDDELAARTVEDRVAVYKKHAGKNFTDTYEKAHDRVRRVVDTNGDGTADASTVFADGFNKAEDGIGSGVLARHGSVYYTCIPSLWRLQDTKDTGRADVKESLSRGYGVHVAFIGHDLHGLRMGPDGKLYFTVGDRGLNVVSREGKRLFYPDTGCVLRCDPDGANLEVVASGLRNPQELAFDDAGNLFTGDNNSDAGDQARWVYVVPGGDSGWRIGFQYGSTLSERGPWHAEKLWHLPHAGQPAYILPPLAHVGAGPSGLTHYPGVGLPERYNDAFFLVDFRGGSGGSGVWALKNEESGASFKPVDKHEFVWNVLATDADFGPDGAFYVSDWVEGWGLNGKGRIYRFAHAQAMRDAQVAEAKKLIAEGFDKRPSEELVKLLSFPQQTVRMEAQFALAARGADAVAAFAPVAANAKAGLARLHAVWGLGMVARKSELTAQATAPLVPLLTDADAKVAGQALQVYGDRAVPGDAAALTAVVSQLKSPSPRVRLFAGMALGSLSKRGAVAQGDTAFEAVLALLRDNADRDAYLRHAGVSALVGMGIDRDPKRVAALAADASPSVRLATAVALRRLGSPAVARLLNDADPLVVAEAARAIHDEPIADALPALAALSDRPTAGEVTLMRAANAHFRLGKPEDAAALARLAANAQAPEAVRVEALEMLSMWASPPRRDRITGVTQSLPARPAEVAVSALKPALGGVFRGGDKLRSEAAKVAGKLGIREVGPALLAIVRDDRLPGSARAEALTALAALKDSRLAEAAEAARRSNDPVTRHAGRVAAVSGKRAEVLAELAKVLADDQASPAEAQGAASLLAALKSPDADAVLLTLASRLSAGTVPPALQLDTVEALKVRRDAKPEFAAALAKWDEGTPKDDPVAAYRAALVGGDAERGRLIFANKSEVYCIRCHKAQGNGGEVGPELTGIGSKQDRRYLLESLVLPNKQIAKGYDSVVIVTTDGKPYTGVLRAETATEVQLVTPEGKPVTIVKDDIEERLAAPSAMPADLITKLSYREVRDLVEYLATVK